MKRASELPRFGNLNSCVACFGLQFRQALPLVLLLDGPPPNSCNVLPTNSVPGEAALMRCSNPALETSPRCKLRAADFQIVGRSAAVAMHHLSQRFIGLGASRCYPEVAILPSLSEFAKIRKRTGSKSTRGLGKHGCFIGPPRQSPRYLRFG